MTNLAINPEMLMLAKAASALRGTWKLPAGPVKDLTALVEAAGAIVIPCDFGTRAMDATSLRLAGEPPSDIHES